VGKEKTILRKEKRLKKKGQAMHRRKLHLPGTLTNIYIAHVIYGGEELNIE